MCTVSWVLLAAYTDPSRFGSENGGYKFLSPTATGAFWPANVNSCLLSFTNSHHTDSERLISDIFPTFFAVGDGSFVETSSGAAARELKKQYDERLGVGTSTKGSYSISPYAITAFVNQHGKQMYRVG